MIGIARQTVRVCRLQGRFHGKDKAKPSSYLKFSHIFTVLNNNNNNNNKLADQSGDDREISFLFQRLSVLIQRYNAILLHDCFVKEEEE